MESFLAITRALSDENRVRALLALGDQEVCVCQLIEFLKLAPSTVSKHMSILKQARLVKGQKRGRWMYYRQAGVDAPAEARLALEWMHACLRRSPKIRQDQNQLKTIAKLDRHELCRRQAFR
jgi:DNA-binding transcriptional ArsR family regulator